MFSAFRTLVYFVAAIMFVSILFSCTSTKQISYFQDLPDKDVVDLPPFQPEERIIEKGDDLYIYFSAKDNEAANYFNKNSTVPSPTTSISGTVPVPMATNAAGYSYIVGNDGFIEIPNLGIVKVTGLNAGQLRAKLLTNVSAYLKDPSVEVRFNTFKISILGEVRTPGRFTLDMQRTTILDALAAAGDLPATAKRYDIKLYRDYNGQRKIYKVDLTRTSILNSPELFQMRHNDILYVTPLKNEIARQNFGTATVIFSLVISIATLGFAILK